MKALPFFDEAGVREENGVTKQFYNCQLCNKEIIGSNASNLASHLYHKHRQAYIENIDQCAEPIQIKRLKLLQNCVSIIALGGRPFACLLDYGFQQIVAKDLKEFELAGHTLNLKHNSHPDVHEYLHRAADLVRDEIKHMIKGRPISVQLDMASRLSRSVFGVDVQYIENSEIIIHNIGMLILNKSHTGENMLENYRLCLQRYDIDRKQVISISGDNGKDVQKMIRLEKTDNTEKPPPTKKVARQLDFDEAEIYEPSQRERKGMDERRKELQRVRDETTNAEIGAILETDEPTDDDVIDMIFEECDINLGSNSDADDSQSQGQMHEVHIEDILQQVATEHNHGDSFNLSGIRCAAHTLQLVVKDALAALPQETKNVIKLCRRVAKILRLESTKFYTEGCGLTLKKPRMDVETRWGSTYIMVR